jgi:hypothetical protein
MIGLGGLLREGAGELFGWAREREVLQEAVADNKVLMRQMETIGWDLSGGTLENYFEPDRVTRETQVERAYRYFFDDPIVKRSVKIRTNYVFRKGVPIPRYREDRAAGDPDDQGRAQELIRRFWEDAENQIALTSKQAQREKNDELTVQGNVYFLLFGQEGEPPETAIGDSTAAAQPDAQPPTMKLTDLRAGGIVEIIMHPANQKIPIYYKRVYRQKVAKFERSGEAAPLSAVYDETVVKPKVRDYRDWRFDPPQDGEIFDGKVWRNPPEDSSSRSAGSTTSRSTRRRTCRSA